MSLGPRIASEQFLVFMMVSVTSEDSREDLCEVSVASKQSPYGGDQVLSLALAPATCDKPCFLTNSSM